MEIIEENEKLSDECNGTVSICCEMFRLNFGARALFGSTRSWGNSSKQALLERTDPTKFNLVTAKLESL